jgi:amidase
VSAATEQPTLRRLPRPETMAYAFDPAAEAQLEVEPGESFVVETEDAFSGRLRREGTLPTPEFLPEMASSPGRFNPVSGPVHVRGAEPGDTLLVHIERIEPAPEGVIALFADMGPGATWRDWRLFDGARRYTVTHEPGPSGTTRDGTAVVGSYRGRMEPLIGTIGVAPEYVAQSTIWGQATHGGVWDHRHVREGSTLLFPVFQPGGLLSLGDVHGVQGDCEFFGVADETRADVQLRCEVRKGATIPYPRIETADALIQPYSYRPLEGAIKRATKLLMEWIREDYGLSEEQAYLLVALNPDFRVIAGNMVEVELINFTVTAELPKAAVESAAATRGDAAS